MASDIAFPISCIQALQAFACHRPQIAEFSPTRSVKIRMSTPAMATAGAMADGSLAVAMGGVDVLIFTDRVGENSAILRAAACEGLECLGLQLDRQRNVTCRSDADVAALESSGRILLIHSREELMIAREAWRVSRGVQNRGNRGG